MTTPQVDLDGMNRAAQVPLATAPVPIPSDDARTETSAPRAMTDAERQGIAMSWVGITLGIFLLLGGLALGAAVALKAGFGGWLLGMGVIGLIMVAVIIVVNYTVLRPRS